MVNLAIGHSNFWQQQAAPPATTVQWGMGFFRGTSAWILLSIGLLILSNMYKVIS